MGRQLGQNKIFRNFYWTLFLISSLGLLGTLILQIWPYSVSDQETIHTRHNLDYTDEVIMLKDAPLPTHTDEHCLFHNCFDVYHCGQNDDNRLTVYIYPLTHYKDINSNSVLDDMSSEFHEILQTVADSIYFMPDPSKACLFLPSIDLLNQQTLNTEAASQALSLLSGWSDGRNHLIFNMMSGITPSFNTTLDVMRGKSVLAGGGFDSLSFRAGFDISIPVYNPLIKNVQLPVKLVFEMRKWYAVSAQPNLHQGYASILQKISTHEETFLYLHECLQRNYTLRCRGNQVYDYPQILQESTFCLVLRGTRLGQLALSDALQAGCIPVIIANSYVMPFDDVLDWKRASVRIREEDLKSLFKILRRYKEQQIYNMRKQVRFYWDSYFSSMRAITLTTLQIINDRVFPYAARKYEDWNEPPNEGVNNPLSLPMISPQSEGFTAVILTFDRLELLFEIILTVSKAPSLVKILVVWNNQIKAPPPAAMWPKISKPLKVVQTRQNKLSNRFYPYDEIETEAILALDDDITMLTTDEIEFGYEVWREFPDRLVGYPSRLHLWDNTTQKWKYESEWTSSISIVLTGAAFYHKYYNYLYTNSMPGNIKQWVDKNMNCEDIAMNFLITNITGSAPIKVTPRQKFRCPECQNFGMLSADLSYMVERSECINKFVSDYGAMPLKEAEFRADPVLYKSQIHIPDSILRYKDIGSL